MTDPIFAVLAIGFAYLIGLIQARGWGREDRDEQFRIWRDRIITEVKGEASAAAVIPFKRNRT